MITKRIIACLDVSANRVVKGVRFRDHLDVGDITELAGRYCQDGADELVFYDITASADNLRVSRDWIERVARLLNIPFCVAGGIRTLKDAEEILSHGADKISINSAAIKNPSLITELSKQFGEQCIVVGVDSIRNGQNYEVCCYTGRESTTQNTRINTLDWMKEVQDRGAGEIVLNCMDRDGTGLGFDLEQLILAGKSVSIPLVASGGAKTAEDFERVFKQTHVDAALGAGAFHNRTLIIPELKQELSRRGVRVRL